MVFAEFDSGMPRLTELLRVGEQWLEMLLDSFNPYLVKESDTMDSCSKYYEDKVAARGFRSLAATVFSKTGYLPPKDTHGLNWNSPMAELGGVSARQSLFTCEKTVDKDGRPILTFQTAGRSCKLQKKEPGSSRLWLMASPALSVKRTCNAISFEISHDAGLGLGPGTRVFPIIEWYCEEQDPQKLPVTHPHSYARLPVPGPYSDYAMLNRLGKQFSKMDLV
jgi:hypothetical protein